MTIKVRFAPSPTGVLHIGSARTALFNFLYAKHTGGDFFLRIEDTDSERSNKESVESIINGLKWLKVFSTHPIIYQTANLSIHKEIVEKLLKLGAAYYCYTSPEELKKFKSSAFKFQSEWRDKKEIPKDIASKVKPVVRLKVPQEGEIILDDIIQGQVKVKNSEIDDMVLLRSDGTPTFLLACAVDDYNMGITHVIRGDDHLSNAFRQIHIFKALGWELPHFAHIPLIHGQDGTKLSKRHGALGIEHYKDEGYLSEAIVNYLLRLGWGHGDDEIISMQQAIEWFNIKDVKKSPASLDFDKLLSLNAHYIKATENDKLVLLLQDKFKEIRNISQDKLNILKIGIEDTKVRATTLDELFTQSKFYISDEPIEMSSEAVDLTNKFDKNVLKDFIKLLQKMSAWDEASLKTEITNFIKENNLKMKEIGPVLRSLLAGSTIAPGIFKIMLALGREKTLRRIQDLFIR
ncbi:MAG: glutamate--tRNA ligase [Rickettsiales bacterium]|nr:glutamate--tRNA ligase [Rickettsiales bacterium]